MKLRGRELISNSVRLGPDIIVPSDLPSLRRKYERYDKMRSCHGRCGRSDKAPSAN